MGRFGLLAMDIFRVPGAVVTDGAGATSPGRLRDGRDHLAAGRSLATPWDTEVDLAGCAVPLQACNCLALLAHNLAAATSPSCEIAWKDNPGDPWTAALTFTPSGVDNYRRFYVAAAHRFWRVRLSAGAAYAAEVGELFLGPELMFPVEPDWQGWEGDAEEPAWPARAATDGQAIKVPPAYTGRRLRLSWAAIEEAYVEARIGGDLRYFRSWWEEAGSQGAPCVVTPDRPPRDGSGDATEPLAFLAVAAPSAPRPYTHRAPFLNTAAPGTFPNLRSLVLDFAGRARDP